MSHGVVFAAVITVAGARKRTRRCTKPPDGQSSAVTSTNNPGGSGKGLHALPGVRLVYMDRTGRHNLLSSTVRPTRVAATPGGCQIGYIWTIPAVVN
jgi:hypothetical protein